MSARVTRRLWVVTGITSDGRVAKFGPASESGELLEGQELYGANIAVVAVLPVIAEGGLLRVSPRDVREAPAEARAGE